MTSSKQKKYIQPTLERTHDETIENLEFYDQLFGKVTYYCIILSVSKVQSLPQWKIYLD